MTAKELIERLTEVAPETEIVGGMFNGRTETYTAFDCADVLAYDDIYNDFFGTPGAFDDKMLKIRSKKVVYLGSLFESSDEQVMQDRSIVWRMRKVLGMHRSKEWKNERIYQLLTEFSGNDFGVRK